MRGNFASQNAPGFHGTMETLKPPKKSANGDENEIKGKISCKGRKIGNLRQFKPGRVLKKVFRGADQTHVSASLSVTNVILKRIFGGLISPGSVVKARDTEDLKKFKKCLTEKLEFETFRPHTEKQRKKTMRTKTLLLTAALSAIGAAAAMAQTVYSVNAVGYVNKTVTQGSWQLMANPLLNSDNKLATILTDAPANTEVQKWNGTAFISAKKVGTSWVGAAGSVAFKPGEGFFIKIPGTATTTLTFVGEVAQNADSNIAFNSGYNLMGSVVPQSGKIQTDLQFPAKANDQILTLKADGSGYNSVKKVGTSWVGTGGEPTIDVGQGFWLNTTAAGTWTRNFSVNQ